MSLILKSEKKKSEPVPSGTHHAVLYGIVDVGTQPSFGDYPARRKAIFLWELPHETGVFDGEERRRVISQSYTLSLSTKSTLFSILKSWLGKPPGDGFDLKEMIGRNCQLSIVHVQGKKDPLQTFANVANVIPLGKGMNAFTPENKTVLFSLPEEGAIAIPDTFPEWIVNRIKDSAEFSARINGAVTTVMS